MSRRFGRGDYFVRTPEGTEDDPTMEARDYFVRVVANEIPEVLSTFRADVVPHLTWLWERLERPWTSAEAFMATTALLGLQAVEGVEALDERAPWLETWSHRWNLQGNPWFALRLVFHAFRAYELGEGLDEGEADPELAEGLWDLLAAPLGRSDIPDSPGATADAIPIEVEPLRLPGWDPTAQSWGEYRRWIEREVLPTILEEHRIRAERDPRLGRAPSTRYHEEHFRALARFQILGESYPELGAGDPDHPLRKAIPRTADLVRLTRRTLKVI